MTTKAKMALSTFVGESDYGAEKIFGPGWAEKVIMAHTVAKGKVTFQEAELLVEQVKLAAALVTGIKMVLSQQAQITVYTESGNTFFSEVDDAISRTLLEIFTKIDASMEAE